MNTRAGGGGRKIRGVIIGIVTNIKDPEEIGRVKVRFPWMDGVDDPIESHWARLCGWYAGNSRGTLYVPEIGDEVLVAFEGGDPNHPYILGAVFNGEHDVPGPGNPDGKNDHKWFRSRAGHDFEFLETDGAEKIRLVDSSQNNSIVYDTAGDTWTTEAKTGTINISAPKGYIHIDCVDFTQTTTKSRKLEVGEKHTVTVGNARTLNVDDANWVVMAGTSMTITTPQFESTTKTDVGVQAGMMVNNQGQSSVEVGKWTELQQGPVVRTAGSQTIATSAYTTVNTQGDSPAVFTLLAGALTVSSKGGVFFNGGPTTMMGGLINSKSSGAVMAKDMNGGKAALSTWLGGLLLLNPNTLTFPATKLLDPIVGMDMHGPTLPAPIPPPAGPLPPLPMVPMPFAGPILIDFKATVLINFRPAAGAGATAISFHMPPLPWPWVPMSYRPILTAAIMALATAPFSAMLEMAKGKMAAMAAGSSNPVLKRGFIADFIGASHASNNAGKVKSAGKTYSVNKGDQGQFSFTRIFPMFSSGQAFLGFLAGLLPLPVATATVNMSSPTTSVCDAPLGMMMPMGSNSCSDVPPIIPNAMPVGFSNVLTGMSIGDFLGQLAWGMVQGAATRRFQAGLRRGGQAISRRMQGGDPPALQNQANAPANRQSDNPALGHPVDPISGTLFDKQIDLDLPGCVPLRLERNYSSVAGERGWGGLLGPGWRLNIESYLTLHRPEGWRPKRRPDPNIPDPRFWLLHDDEMRVIRFPWLASDGDFTRDTREQLEFCRAGHDFWDVTDRAGVVWRYHQHEPDRARLVAWMDRHGNQCVVAYPDASSWRPEGIIDSHDRQLRLEYDHENRLHRVYHLGADAVLLTYRYDAQRRLTAVIAADGATRRYAYDRQHRVVREQEPGGYQWYFHYDDLGRCEYTYGEDCHEYVKCTFAGPVTHAQDGRGAVEHWQTDDDGRVVGRIDREGGVHTFEYDDDHGTLARAVAPNGAESSYERDAEGRLIKQIAPDGGTTRWRYDDRGRLVEIIDPCGAREVRRYDARGRCIETIAADGIVTRRRYDARGQVVWESIDGVEARFGYDPQGLRVSETRDGQTTRFGYDALGRCVLEIDPAGGLTTLRRDPCGRLIEKIRPDGRRERWTFDANGELIERQSLDGRVWRITRDTMGRILERTTPAGRRLETRRGDDNRYASHLDAAGQGYRYRYDKEQRLVRHTTSDGAIDRYRRDPAGHVVLLRGGAGDERRRYNDPCGRPLQLKTRDGIKHQYRWDPLGRLVGARERPPGVANRARADRPEPGEVNTSVRRSLTGRILEEIGPNGRVRQRFATGDRLRSISVDGVRFTIERDRAQAIRAELRGLASWDFGPGTCQHGGCQRVEADGSWQLLADGIAVAAYQVRREPLHGRVREERLSIGAMRQWTHRYSHDLDGQLEGHDTAGRFSPRGARHGAGHRLIEWDAAPVEYDGGGRVIAMRDEHGADLKLYWDDLHRLEEVEVGDDVVLYYRYDALNRLISRAEHGPDGVRAWRFVWCGDRLVSEERPDGSRLRYVHLDDAPGAPFAICRQSADKSVEVAWLHHDVRGVPILATGIDGEVLWSAEYEAHGRQAAALGRWDLQLGLVGMWYDPLIGLAYNRHRWYAPDRGHYLTPDPLGIAGGLTPYGYADGDPVHRTDPLGLATHNPKGTPGEVNGAKGTEPRAMGGGDGGADGYIPSAKKGPYTPKGQVHSQEQLHTCVAASTKMILDDNGAGVEYFGQKMPASESMVSDSLGMKSDGAYVSDAPAALKDFGVDGYQYKENMTINDLQQATQNGPAIVSVKPEGKGAHALVVDSVQDGKVNIRDPWPSGSGSAYSLPVDEFQQSWNGGKGAVIP